MTKIPEDIKRVFFNGKIVEILYKDGTHQTSSLEDPDYFEMYIKRALTESTSVDDYKERGEVVKYWDIELIPTGKNTYKVEGKEKETKGYYD